MSTYIASAGRLEPAPAVRARPGGLGHVLVFAALSVGLAAAATLTGNTVPPALVPFVLAFVPTLFALAFAWREGGGAVRRLLRTAVTRPNRRAWYLTLALPLVWAFATVGVAIALGEPTTGLFDGVFPRIMFIVALVLLPAFAEEIAWRGYAVNRLLPSMSPLAAALVLGVPWAVLHLFLQLPGQMNAGLEGWPTLLSLVAYSVVLTWIYVGSGGSVLLTALVHAGFNGVAPLMANLEADRAWIIRAVLAAGVAVAVIAAGWLRRRGESLGDHAIAR
ncbi:MAG TPA: CPBP family intramembrane glutamic endopeptidase, partial [Candidatus Limnocylindrales bacterium]|nr:CPBP family intramembrane glutamic endopeptidase [Candidatus Limnocylindrales bacterium]